MNRLRILRAGLCSTVQDLGRTEYRHFGVPVGGAMDRLSHELANRLVGNRADAATIEMTLTGDEIEFAEDSLIAITGANMSPILHSVDAESCQVAQHCPVRIPSGARLRFQTAQSGCRSYLAIAGGVDVPIVMKSRSTDLRSGFGGLSGRLLTAGDELHTGTLPLTAAVILAQLSILRRPADLQWFVRTVDLPNADIATLRIISATHTSWLGPAALTRLPNSVFRISSQSDRMGYRLVEQHLCLWQQKEILSEGSVPGTIQLPPDGNPILLMADCAPTGGYPRIGHVISADLGRAGQLRPGQLVQFALVTLEQAQDAFRQQRQDLERAMTIVHLMIQQRKT